LKTTYKSLKDNKRKFVILFINATSEKNYNRKEEIKHVFSSLI